MGAALTAGSCYNLTFVQRGLVDLGTRLVGMSPEDVPLGDGAARGGRLRRCDGGRVVMDRRGWSTDLRLKIRLLLADRRPWSGQRAGVVAVVLTIRVLEWSRSSGASLSVRCC